MTVFRELNLNDKTAFIQQFQLIQPETSDLTFTNLFMWRNSYNLRVCFLAELDFWILLATPRQWPHFFLPPVGDWSNQEKLSAVLKFMRETAESNNFKFLMRRIPKHLTDLFQDLDPKLLIKSDRNTFDYLYLSKNLINLEGRSYHSKRNHLNQFIRKYQWEYHSLSAKHLEQCLNMQSSWFNLAVSPERNLNDEELAMSEVLRNYQELGVEGGVVTIDGKVQAIAVGERLSINTAVIHIEKANIEYQGIYAAINQQFASKSWSQYQFINREEDMGIPGLRQAKLSYHPVKMVDKYTLHY